MTDEIIVSLDNCNWLGGEVIAENTNAPGFSTAGYTDIVTSDGVVHGQVKQSANFAFVRVYYSGHEVPFYQPVLALEMFERALAGTDVATGQAVVGVGSNYTSVGTARSTFREGNATVQWEVLDADATYNTTTGAPDPAGASSNGTAAVAARLDARSSSLETLKKTRGNAKLKPVQKRTSRREAYYGVSQRGGGRWWN